MWGGKLGNARKWVQLCYSCGTPLYSNDYDYGNHTKRGRRKKYCSESCRVFGYRFSKWFTRQKIAEIGVGSEESDNTDVGEALDNADLFLVGYGSDGRLTLFAIEDVRIVFSRMWKSMWKRNRRQEINEGSYLPYDRGKSLYDVLDAIDELSDEYPEGAREASKPTAS